MLFTRRFFLLFALGSLPLLFLWSSFIAKSNLTRGLKWGLLVYDIVLLAAAYFDYRRTENARQIHVRRVMPRRFMIGEENEVQIHIGHHAPRRFTLQIKDEYPPDLELRGDRMHIVTPRRKQSSFREAVVGYRLYAASRGDYGFGDVVMRWQVPRGLVVTQVRIPTAESVKVYPNIHEARRHELSAQRNRQLLAGLRKTRMRGQGREFESLRDYVRGDELRHVSWTATARRGRLIT